ncbi:hypothetical protein C8K61_101133 [Pseudomonas sp. GV071]|nr:hypothetical protein C8K61_101133 [Pseudomonas sp. GV071]
MDLLKARGAIALCSVLFVAPDYVRSAELEIVNKPVLNIDSRSAPINGSPAGSSVFLHYCLPDFKPLLVGGCNSAQARKYIVQVGYHYFLDGSVPPRLEAASRYVLPFEYHRDFKGKTPYFRYYEQVELAKRIALYKVGSSQSPYSGLLRYELSGAPVIVWIPEAHRESTTRLGNPLVFFCVGPTCSLDLDLGNGWVVTAQFDESALGRWHELYLNIYKSTEVVVGG